MAASIKELRASWTLNIDKLTLTAATIINAFLTHLYRPKGLRCESHFGSRGREFDPGTVPYFLEIEHEKFSTVNSLPSAESFEKGCCQLQAKVCARMTG